MVKITGSDGVSRRLRGLAGPTLDRNLGKALFTAASELAVEAQLSLTNGAVSGKFHVPSKPGEPPKNDTGVLANNIEIAASGAGTANPRATVSSNAPYSKALEFGTSKLAERPFMRPAAAKMRDRTKELITQALNATARQTQGA